MDKIYLLSYKQLKFVLGQSRDGNKIGSFYFLHSFCFT